MNDDALTPTYGSRWCSESIPKYRLPDSPLLPETAYRIVMDELNLDGNPALNLASFVSTWMEPEAEQLFMHGATRNLVDQDEYPQLNVIEQRIIRMQASLFNAPDNGEPVGFSTVGSSEAIMLALLAHKWNWRTKRKTQGLEYNRPNIVFGADVHTCWEKFARYFDVEMRRIPLQPDRYTINGVDVLNHIDENTIAVGAVIGTTFTGQMDDVVDINEKLIHYKHLTGQEIPIHVDAASGGFILPFVAPEFPWDFRLEQVRSINVSNHKFGLVYAGLGSVIFRDKQVLHKELPFSINYLGGEMKNYSLNFSRSSAMLLVQYYQFLRLGKDGYQRIMHQIMANARYLEKKLIEQGNFELLTDVKFLPVVVVRLLDESRYTVFDLSDQLRKFGWIIPAYTLPANASSISVLRMVVKENLSRDLMDKLLQDIHQSINVLSNWAGNRPENVPEKDNASHGVC
ncbi:glutamate decarboxylase [Candidatus Sororendozoicomonas aggregata]|uniref:glutamate decarboxylase n=1 Tax=Candidatus Sororendozoicomonas aggregata TaxID=3073239 RepID=UPI002ED1909D